MCDVGISARLHTHTQKYTHHDTLPWYYSIWLRAESPQRGQKQCQCRLQKYWLWIKHAYISVVVGDRNMTEISHGFFQSYNCGHRLTMVIKSLKKTSKSVRRYMKSWGLGKIFKIFFFRFNSNLSETPRNSIKKLDPPFIPPLTLRKISKILGIGQKQSVTENDHNHCDRNFGSITGHRWLSYNTT